LDLLAKLLATPSRGGTDTPAAKTFAAYRRGPGPSRELDRICALPRRRITNGEELAKKWTELLRRPGGTMWLNDVQGIACEEAHTVGGLLGLIGVGKGKTLISLLLGTVWAAGVVVLLVPPKLKTKLFDLEYPVLSKHFRIPNLVGHPVQYTDTKAVLHVVAYSELSSVKRADVLERIRPDAVICDEGHSLRHATAARTKRFKRFYKNAKSRGYRVKTAVLSGSLTSGSIRDYAHLADVTLGDGSPLPRDWSTLQEWSFALDASDFPAPDGELRRLCELVVDPPVVGARAGFARRLSETPGVVVTTSNSPGMSLVFDRKGLKTPPAVNAALEKLRREWVRPDGMPLGEAIEVYAAARQLSCGFYYRTIYPRNEPLALRREWLDAKRAYFAEARVRLNQSVQGQDSYLLLWNAAEAGRWKAKHFAAWKAIKDQVEPDTETVWIDKFAVNAAIEWALERPGIVWVESEAVRAAEEIGAQAGLPVFAGGEEDAARLHKEDGSRSIVCSINAFSEGENLQCFDRNLILTPPSSAKLLEQAIGRTHRQGQKSDEVTVDFCLHTPELVKALKDAREKARVIQETTLNEQKLNIGTWLFEL
jgi:hypothetical protein